MRTLRKCKLTSRALIVAYALYFLLSTEMAARIALHWNPILALVEGRDDASSRIAWVNRHHGGLGNLDNDSAYHFLIYDASRGWALAPNVKNLSVFHEKTLNSNSKGIRGATEYPYQRQPGKQRILVFGDSYTFGDEVSDDETYEHYLEELLPGTEVLNMGVSGYGYDQMLIYLKQEGLKYRPDVVMVGVVWFDRDRTVRKFNDFAKPKFVLDSGRLVLTNVPVPRPESVAAGEWRQLSILDIGEMLLTATSWRIGLVEKRARTVTDAIFDEIVATSREAGAEPVFAYLPVMEETLNSDPRMSSEEQDLSSYCERTKVSCVFLRPNFTEDRKRGIEFPTRAHWGSRGSLTVAHGISDFLVEKHFIWKNKIARPALRAAEFGQ